MDFAADNIHVTARVRIDLPQLALQQLQMKNDGVDRILNFVGHAAGQTAAGG